eukprot:g72149.t1
MSVPPSPNMVTIHYSPRETFHSPAVSNADEVALGLLALSVSTPPSRRLHSETTSETLYVNTATHVTQKITPNSANRNRSHSSNGSSRSISSSHVDSNHSIPMAISHGDRDRHHSFSSHGDRSYERESHGHSFSSHGDRSYERGSHGHYEGHPSHGSSNGGDNYHHNGYPGLKNLEQLPDLFEPKQNATAIPSLVLDMPRPLSQRSLLDLDPLATRKYSPGTPSTPVGASPHASSFRSVPATTAHIKCKSSPRILTVAHVSPQPSSLKSSPRSISSPRIPAIYNPPQIHHAGNTSPRIPAMSYTPQIHHTGNTSPRLSSRRTPSSHMTTCHLASVTCPSVVSSRSSPPGSHGHVKFSSDSSSTRTLSRREASQHTNNSSYNSPYSSMDNVLSTSTRNSYSPTLFDHGGTAEPPWREARQPPRGSNLFAHSVYVHGPRNSNGPTQAQLATSQQAQLSASQLLGGTPQPRGRPPKGKKWCRELGKWVDLPSGSDVVMAQVVDIGTAVAIPHRRSPILASVVRGVKGPSPVFGTRPVSGILPKAQSMPSVPIASLASACSVATVLDAPSSPMQQQQGKDMVMNGPSGPMRDINGPSGALLSHSEISIPLRPHCRKRVKFSHAAGTSSGQERDMRDVQSDQHVDEIRNERRRNPTISNIPLESLAEVFSFLTALDLARVAAVSKDFRRCTEEVFDWMAALKKTYPMAAKSIQTKAKKITDAAAGTEKIEALPPDVVSDLKSRRFQQETKRVLIGQYLAGIGSNQATDADRRLLRLGMTPLERVSEDKELLRVTTFERWEEATRMLNRGAQPCMAIEYGSYENPRTNLGMLPLHFAARDCAPLSFIKRLVQALPEAVYYTEANGFTPLDLLRQCPPGSAPNTNQYSSEEHSAVLQYLTSSMMSLI